MKLFLSGRHTGKTTELIKLAAERFCYIVCRSRAEADRISRIAKELNFDIPYPITYVDFIRADYYHKGIRGFVIDDIDALLLEMCPYVPIVGVALNTDQDTPPQRKTTDATTIESRVLTLNC